MFCSLSVCLDVICVWTEALTFHMDILKYLCLNYSHVPSFVMSVSSVRTGVTSAHNCAFILTILYVFYVSVFLDGKGVSNDDGQMSQFIQLVSLLTMWTTRSRFFLTFSVKLYRIFNEVVYSRKKKKVQSLAVISRSMRHCKKLEHLYTFLRS